MLLAALSTGHKVGLGLVALAFVVFALASAFLIPRFRPEYPGRRGLGAFLALAVALFLGMIAAIVFLAREPSESHAAGKATTSPAAASGGATQTIAVSESEFKIQLASKALRRGTYKFVVANKGHLAHDLVVKGPNASSGASPTIAPGKSTSLTVALVPGTYELYCSLPGHKQAGMDLHIKVA